MWPEVNIINGRMSVTLPGEPPLEDLRPMPIGDMKVGDSFELELREGEYVTVTVDEISVSQYEDDDEIYFCIDNDCREYEVCSDEVNWDTVDRSQRTRTK
jgi:hypothetical protein